MISGIRRWSGAVVRQGCIALAVGALGVGPAMAHAVSTAQISGTAKDQSGAALRGVEVTVTQTAAGAKRSVVTDETGSYVLTNLPIGPSMLEASLAGFRPYVQTGIVLQINTNPVINVT